MRKLMKLMAVTAIASISTFQVVACKDDSLNETFLKDVDNTKINNTAFFGFLGSADNEASKELYNIFNFLNSADDQGNIRWEDWNKTYETEIKKAGLTHIDLNIYQGPPHDPVPSDPIAGFWDDKSITWQKNIFNWVYSRSNLEDNPDYQIPQGFSEIKEISTTKDGSDNERFQNLPIIFIIKQGRLITSGENWIPIENEDWRKSVAAVGQFVLANLFI